MSLNAQQKAVLDQIVADLQGMMNATALGHAPLFNGQQRPVISTFAETTLLALVSYETVDRVYQSYSPEDRYRAAKGDISEADALKHLDLDCVAFYSLVTVLRAFNMAAFEIDKGREGLAIEDTIETAIKIMPMITGKPVPDWATAQAAISRNLAERERVYREAADMGEAQGRA